MSLPKEMEMRRHLKASGAPEILLTAQFKVPKHQFQCKITSLQKQYYWAPLKTWAAP